MGVGGIEMNSVYLLEEKCCGCRECCAAKRYASIRVLQGSGTLLFACGICLECQLSSISAHLGG